MNRRILGMPVWLIVVAVGVFVFRDKLKPMFANLMEKFKGNAPK